MIRVRRGVLARWRTRTQTISHRCRVIVRTEPCCFGYADCNDHIVRCYEPISRLRWVLAGTCREHQGASK